MTYDGPRYDKEEWRASVLNGRIGPGKLHPVEAWPVPYDRDLRGPCVMHPEAAAAMGVMLRTAWDAGHTSLRPVLSYRTYAFQLQKWEDYQRGGNLAATPGTSNHGWAVSGDMSWKTSAAWSWMSQKCRTFGFALDVPTENWHLTYQEHTWKGDDVTEDELAQITAATQWLDGDRLYRNKYAEGGKDPGPPPENFPPAKREGWGSARFAVRLDAVHMNSEHGD